MRRQGRRTVRIGLRQEMYTYGNAYGTHTKCIQAYKRVKERGIPSSTSSHIVCSSIFYCSRFSGNHSPLLAFSGMYVPHWPHCPSIQIAGGPPRSNHGVPPAKKVCMHCMHQKTDYARYARTQLRKRLHTMHTKTRIGVSVGLRARKCMHTGMHTERIRNAYKHIKRR